MLISALESADSGVAAVSERNDAVRLLTGADYRRGRGDSTYYESVLEEESGIHWWRLRPECPPKFTREVVDSLRRFQDDFGARMRRRLEDGDSVPGYHVLTSDIDGVFNLGGDLSYFHRLIRARDRHALAAYARECVELVYQNATAFGLPMTTIALVKGNALGGGMEAALSARIVVAERQVSMGLPEILFNMFPGMGAYQFLSRRMAPAAAEKLILSGRIYTAEELHALGVVDHLAETGEGEDMVRRVVRRERNHGRAAAAFRAAVEQDNPITRDSLLEFVERWVDTAMRLDDRDLNHMRYLIRSQQSRGW